ncbi:MAG: FMN-dependent NADH-azoreductase [Mesorhizobium sp.]|uniref:FMN-dependent NADH-azoreductase n=1 Tax=unclassified Mesorhizobium TaxID=325217 RepID=UPI000FE8B6FC|nr:MULTISPECIES: NAD(P)H-dependent oxidoreductase [unclassified Mesorhizobium]RWB30188.1 MAG: FMN-dependent NADH-azoreductase [Mesorhizobium sp.]RWB79336.1 MAG: FMN-dependent NADH-azoreductase [Mesorhizobium sp.]RWC08175.1 MAG: FMN-dependent NADH-azoreductase [Mesorhizobium sp.]RWC37213.1 MAG: FMN-dependent NADH-azoreductase [Mesorhizobium sp.]RWD21608.1 MAG: FMN-dependent NADH-azoreductase [Mesorhizobium sp.]
MTKLLHIVSSPRKECSASREVAEAFVQSYRARRPDLEISTLDLWDVDLPEFGEDAMLAKYAGLSGTPLTPSQQQAWATLQELAQQLHWADILLLSTPLWNFSIPYRLKHFIDLVSQKDILFSFDPEHGFGGLLRDKIAVVVYARGLDYAAQSITPAQRFDYQKPYIQAWLRFIGIEDVRSLIIQKTLFGPDIDHAARQDAREAASRLAEDLLSRTTEAIA